MSRRFPTPWTVHQSEAAFWVQDAVGHQFGYVYFRQRPDQPDAAHLLSFDEARRIATNIAKLPGLLSRQPPR